MPSKRWSGKSIEVRVRDVLVSIGRIHEFITGLDRDAFLGDQKTQSAVERELLTVCEACIKIGALEASQNVPLKERLATRFPEIPWPAVRGIGNILRHDYGRVDPKVIWDTVSSDDLRSLESTLAAAFPHQKSSNSD